MNDDTTNASLIIVIIILTITTVGLGIGQINKDCNTNNQICRRLYTNTTDYFKCTTYDITHTINLIQPLNQTENKE